MRFVFSLLPEFFIVFLSIFIEGIFNILFIIGFDQKANISTLCIALYSTVLHKAYEELSTLIKNKLVTVVTCCFFYPDKEPDIDASPQFQLKNRNGIAMTTIGIHLEVNGSPSLLRYKIVILGDKCLTNQLHKRLSKKMQSVFAISSSDNSIEIDLNELFDTREKHVSVKYDFHVDVIGEVGSEMLSSVHTGEIYPALKDNYVKMKLRKLFLSFRKNNYSIRGETKD